MGVFIHGGLAFNLPTGCPLAVLAVDVVERGSGMAYRASYETGITSGLGVRILHTQGDNKVQTKEKSMILRVWLVWIGIHNYYYGPFCLDNLHTWGLT